MPSSQRVASPINSLGAFIATFAAEIPAWSLIAVAPGLRFPLISSLVKVLLLEKWKRLSGSTYQHECGT